jgi:hypothetical protein
LDEKKVSKVRSAPLSSSSLKEKQAIMGGAYIQHPILTRQSSPNINFKNLRSIPENRKSRKLSTKEADSGSGKGARNTRTLV